jgi:histidinol dehydrogenase
MSHPSLLAVRGSLGALGPRERVLLLDRQVLADDSVRDRTREIIRRVREEGDGALRALARDYDGVALDTLDVPREEWRAAGRDLEPSLGAAVRRAARNIERVHRAQIPSTIEIESESGVVVGRRPDPLERVGVYAPGGRASYPSSVLMGAIPARVAGVREIILCAPPARGTALPSKLTLAAAEIAGVDQVFAVGGAGAIAAMAYGTHTIPRVDRIVGPGNAYVAEAKAQVATVVGTDAPAGPSELLVIADGSADATVIAREMLAQAEHDPDASVVALVTGVSLAEQIESEIARLLPRQERMDIISAALQARGAVVVVDSLEEAVRAAAQYAPEHLLLAGSEAATQLPNVRNAGTVFVGTTSSVSFGDYMTGANHVLPTGALARSYSGLSVLDFIRWTTYQIVSPAAASRMAEDVGVFADAEGLGAHAQAARMWAGATDRTGVLS